MSFEETVNSTLRDTIDKGQQAADKATQAVKEGYEAAHKFVADKGFDVDDVREFVRREPWLAVAAAFAIGYVAAQIVKRIS